MSVWILYRLSSKQTNITFLRLQFRLLCLLIPSGIHLTINGEPILFITPQDGTGIRILPFFTGIKTAVSKITGRH